MKVMNVSRNAKQFIVAREVDNELWYWGSFDNRDKANETAMEVDGVMIEREMVEA